MDKGHYKEDMHRQNPDISMMTEPTIFFKFVKFKFHIASIISKNQNWPQNSFKKIFNLIKNLFSLVICVCWGGALNTI